MPNSPTEGMEPQSDSCEAINCRRPATWVMGNVIHSTGDSLQLCDGHAAVAEWFDAERIGRIANA